ncbi:hypothetical protein FIBSPDRAFT_850089 [Athelia psychrophila]|uniref:Uncharacterized protein n=1 Tax=Athelia psychrophila TaxID=1759441 RepID=A0A166TXM5_9AGAM|nr:hypothetical protein FIBSPDRAFT_850089 [Fibularhizoctonia sp. CBS 109695]
MLQMERYTVVFLLDFSTGLEPSNPTSSLHMTCADRPRFAYSYFLSAVSWFGNGKARR